MVELRNLAGQDAARLSAALMPSIESHLDTAWPRTEVITCIEVSHIDASLLPLVEPLIRKHGSLPPKAILDALHRDVLDYFERCVALGELFFEPVFTPIVQHFGAALVELADAAEEASALSAEKCVTVAFERLDAVLRTWVSHPQDVDRAKFHALQSHLYDALENALDVGVVRGYFRDRIYHLRERLRLSSRGAGNAIAALDELLDDPSLAG